MAENKMGAEDGYTIVSSRKTRASPLTSSQDDKEELGVTAASSPRATGKGKVRNVITEKPMRDQNQPPSLCNYYLKGHCKFGEQCKDLHPGGKCVGNDMAGGDKYKVEDYMTIYVCNIPDFIDEENLSLIAAEHGKVVRMPNIVRISRISSGLKNGFIQMTCRYAAAATVDHINELELADGSYMSARIDEEKSRFKPTWKDLQPSAPEVKARGRTLWSQRR